MNNVLNLLFLAPLLHLCLSQEEIDLNILSSYDDPGYESDVFNAAQTGNSAGILIFDSISDTTIEKICIQNDVTIYITEEDITIDCKNIRAPIIEANIVKRDVDGIEGSGDVDVIEDDIGVNQENKDIKEETIDSDKKEEAAELQLNKEEDTVNSSNKAVDDTVNAPSEDSDDKSVITDEKPVVSEIVPKINEGTTISDNKEEFVSSPPENVNKETEKETPADEGLTVTETVSKQTSQTSESSSESAEDKVTTSRPQETTTKEEERRETTEQANTSLKEIKFQPKEDGGPKKGKSLANPQNVNSGSESAKTGESTETKQAGTKDTTILVVLFVAVCVIGAAAFGYNFIKKRKQQSADLERVERGGNSSLKRSLQNLAKPEAPEQEMKPLISGEKKDVEMVELKKENGNVTATEHKERS